MSHLFFSVWLFAILTTGFLVYNNIIYTTYVSAISNSNVSESDHNRDNESINDTPYGERREEPKPALNDTNLKLELITEGLRLPTQMAFIAPNDILVLEKDTGMVKRVINGQIQREPLLDVNVATAYERGLLGIAVSHENAEKGQDNVTNVFIYYTESKRDADDVCTDTGTCNKKTQPLGNRLYKYKLEDNRLISPELLLDLPAKPGAVHNGGAILFGADKNIYIPIGEVGYQSGQISNNYDGPAVNGTGGILRVTPEGKPVTATLNKNDETSEQSGLLGNESPLNLYFAYGIRNSFGIDFDPITGKLWDTENGPGFGDEINLVEPGFNGGWNKIAGMWQYELKAEEKLREQGLNYYGGEVAPEHPDNLVNFDGNGKYSSPEFVWNQTIGVTAIKFLGSHTLGKNYQNDIFVGDIHNGNLYHFDLTNDRRQLLLEGVLADKIANNQGEREQALLGQGFNGITDIEVGPDGYLYVLSFAGNVYRISR